MFSTNGEGGEDFDTPEDYAGQAIQALLNDDVEPDQIEPDRAGDYSKPVRKLKQASSDHGAEKAREIWGELQSVPGLSDIVAGDRVGLHPQTGDDIFQELPEEEFLVEDVFRQDSINLIYARAASHKTNLTVDLACNLIQGDEWLEPDPSMSEIDGFHCDPSNILWVDLEMGKRRVMQRFQWHMRGNGIDEGDDVLERFYWASNPRNPRFILQANDTHEAIQRTAESRELDAIFIDHFRAATPGLDENESEIYQVFSNLRNIAESCGVSFFLIHHARKSGSDQIGDDARGSGVFRDAPDKLLRVDREKHENIITIEDVKSRGKPIPPQSAYWSTFPDKKDVQEARFYGMGSPEADELTAVQEARKHLPPTLEENPGIGKKALVKELADVAGVGRNKAGVAVDEAEKAGQVEVEEGKHGKRKHFLSEASE